MCGAALDWSAMSGAAPGAPAGAGRGPGVGSDGPGPGQRLDIELRGLLDNVRSAVNVGAMLRTADAMGVSHVHLAGITPAGDHPQVGKTALGAEHAVRWSRHRDGPALVARLQLDGWLVWVLETGSGAEPLAVVAADLRAAPAGDDGPPATRVVVVVGHEVAGVDPAILAVADRRVAIPMRGVKRSLNVATAFGIASYALTTPG